MTTSNVIYRIFQLKWNDVPFSGFTIDVDDRQYLCTAKHCLNDFDSEEIE